MSTCESVPLLAAEDGSEDEEEEEEERQEQMSRVAVALVALSESALCGSRFPTTSLSQDLAQLKQLGPEQPGERERAGAGGWRAAGSGGKEAERAARVGWAGDYKPSWRDEERRAMHRKRMALVVRIREKKALRALAVWARHPCRSGEDLLPPLRRCEPLAGMKEASPVPPDGVDVVCCASGCGKCA